MCDAASSRMEQSVASVAREQGVRQSAVISNADPDSHDLIESSFQALETNNEFAGSSIEGFEGIFGMELNFFAD